MLDWLRRLFGNKPKEREASERPTKPQVSKPTVFIPEGESIYGHHPRTILVPRAGSKISTKSIGKHMKGKHGRQSSQYRASVKRKRQPKDDEF